MVDFRDSFITNFHQFMKTKVMDPLPNLIIMIISYFQN